MIFVRDKGQMCNNILQYAHVYAWARENNRSCMSMRFAYKYQFFNICSTPYHNFPMYLLGKYCAKLNLLPVVTYNIGDEDTANKEATILSHTHVIVEGWGVRHYDLLTKYKQEIIKLFGFKQNILDKISQIIYSTSQENSLKIGIHIRRGDYKTFYGGKYHFSDEIYMDYIQKTISLNPHRHHTVYICSNDAQLNRGYFSSNLPDVNVVFPEGNAGEDLCQLASCDYIIGPPSSFSLVATMYGHARLHWITAESSIKDINDFKNFDTLFRIFDNFWI